MYYQELSNMKPPEFDEIKELIVDMRWIFDDKGFFYTCSCPKNQNLMFALNHLRLGAKDWWKFATQGLSIVERAVIYGSNSLRFLVQSVLH